MKPSPEEILKAQRSLSLWSGTRSLAGILVIVAILLMIVSAVVAFREGTSTSRAMQLPLGTAVGAALLFVRSVKRLQAIQALLRR